MRVKPPVLARTLTACLALLSVLAGPAHAQQKAAEPPKTHSKSDPTLQANSSWFLDQFVFNVQQVVGGKELPCKNKGKVMPRWVARCVLVNRPSSETRDRLLKAGGNAALGAYHDDAFSTQKGQVIGMWTTGVTPRQFDVLLSPEDKATSALLITSRFYLQAPPTPPPSTGNKDVDQLTQSMMDDDQALTDAYTPAALRAWNVERFGKTPIGKPKTGAPYVPLSSLGLVKHEYMGQDGNLLRFLRYGKSSAGESLVIRSGALDRLQMDRKYTPKAPETVIKLDAPVFYRDGEWYLPLSMLKPIGCQTAGKAGAASTLVMYCAVMPGPEGKGYGAWVKAPVKRF